MDYQNEKVEENCFLKSDLENLFHFIEDILQTENLLLMQDSTHSTSNTEEDQNKVEKKLIKKPSEDLENAFTDFINENDSDTPAASKEFIFDKYNDSNFISEVPISKKSSIQTRKNKKKKLYNNHNLNHKISLENGNDCKDKYKTVNINKTDLEKTDKYTILEILQSEKKKFSSIKKEALEKEIESSQKDDQLQAKGNIKQIFSKIEVKLRCYLKDSQAQKVFDSKNFESFLNEGKLNTPSSFQTIKSQTPSIIKNFFEDKEVIEVTKKRHSVAGEGLQNQLEKLKDLEFKQKKSLSNNRETEYFNDIKDLSRKKSNISDFSINISDQYVENNILADDLENNLNQTSTSNGEIVGRLSGIRLSKRGSILRERLNNLNLNKFDVVQEEDRIIDSDGNANEESKDSDYYNSDN